MTQFKCSEVIEAALWRAARRQLPPAALKQKALTEAIIRRSRRYTTQRTELSVRPTMQDLAARALFFTIADAPKVILPLLELHRQRALASQRPITIADLGAGIGAMSLGSFAVFTSLLPPAVRPSIHVTALDQDAAALRLFQEVFRELPTPFTTGVTLDTVITDVRSHQLSCPYDLIFVGSLLNELNQHQATTLVAQCMDHLSQDGSLVIIEPALQETSRTLHQLRDTILTKQLGHVFAPCTRSSTPCPSLANDNDWCHEDRPTQLPPQAQKLAQITGLRKHGLKFSYLVLRRHPLSQLEVAPPQEPLRVVSRLHKQKGQLTCYGCGQGGRIHIRLLKRNRSLQNRIFQQLRRGDLLILEPSEEIRPDQSIDCIRTSNAIW